MKAMLKKMTSIIPIIVMIIFASCSDPARCQFSKEVIDLAIIDQGDVGKASFVVFNRGDKKLIDTIMCDNSSVQFSNRFLNIDGHDSLNIDIEVLGNKIGINVDSITNSYKTCRLNLKYSVDFPFNENTIEELVMAKKSQFEEDGDMWFLNTYIGRGSNNGYAFGFNCDKKIIDAGVKAGILVFVGTGNNGRHYCTISSKAKTKYEKNGKYRLNSLKAVDVVKFRKIDDQLAEADVRLKVVNNEIGAAYYGYVENLIDRSFQFKKWNDGWHIE